MKKINIIKENDEYNRIINNVKPFKYKDYVVYKELNDTNTYKFGFSVGKKVGNAVTRNRIKRQVKSILDKNLYEKGFKCIIMVRKSILTKSFNEMEEELSFILNKINIKKGEANEKNKENN